jgi:tetratricopeptide (TPR) repeat protein
MSQGDFPSAKTWLASEIKLAGDDAEVLVSMASMLLVLADEGHLEFSDAFDYAVNCLLHAIDIDPSDADAHYYLGCANAMDGRDEDAIEFFTHALEINPQHVLAIRDSAIVHLAMRQLNDAADVIDRGFLTVGNHPEFKKIRSKIRRSQIAQQLANLFGKSKR